MYLPRHLLLYVVTPCAGQGRLQGGFTAAPRSVIARHGAVLRLLATDEHPESHAADAGAQEVRAREGVGGGRDGLGERGERWAGGGVPTWTHAGTEEELTARSPGEANYDFPHSPVVA